MTHHEYLQQVRRVFSAQGNPDTARGQMAYMRHQFEYYGLKAPHWLTLTAQLHAELGIPQGDDLEALVRLAMEDEYREINYFGLETLQKTLKKQPETCIDLLEDLICTRSWWDTVDWLAKLVGMHFQRYPHLIRPVTERWMASGNMWLQRICLIFQLRYKDKTDTALLFGYILRLAHSKEFFIQKGAGWALRHYSRTNPEAVRTFIESHTLPPLTRREGLRLMKD